MSSENTVATGLAGRYANALFALADGGSALDSVATDLMQLRGMIDGSVDLQRLIRSPVISREGQAKAMAALIQQAGLSDLTRRFVGTLTANRRLFALTDVIGEYLKLLAARRGEVTADVLSAQELTGDQLTALSGALKKAVGSAVALNAKVDPTLLGGLVVKVGSRMVDSSLRTKLQHLKLAMKGVA